MRFGAERPWHLPVQGRHGAVLDRLERSTRQRSWHGLSFPRLRSTLVRLGHAESAVAGTPGTGGIRERHHRSLRRNDAKPATTNRPLRSEEHTSELQSLMRISYAVFCLKK